MPPELNAYKSVKRADAEKSKKKNISTSHLRNLFVRSVLRVEFLSRVG